MITEDYDDIFGEGVGSDYVCKPSERQIAKAHADRADARALAKGGGGGGGGGKGKEEEEMEEVAPELKWEDEDGGGGDGGGGAEAANAMVKSLLAKSKHEQEQAAAAERRKKKGIISDGSEGNMTVVEEDDDVDDSELLKASRSKKAGAQVPKGTGKDLAMGGSGGIGDEGDAYGELLPDTYEGYDKSLQLGYACTAAQQHSTCHSTHILSCCAQA